MVSQIPATVCVGPPPPTKGKFITILSIDGGGIRGIIPGVLLERLEKELQEFDGKEARIADYFDVIAGTSTGGIVTTMLTAPDENNRPLFAANEIVPFYVNECPGIFPQKSVWLRARVRSWWPDWWPSWWYFKGSKYDGKYLKELLEKKLGSTRIHQTLTNGVIPTFDIKTMQPVIFSSFQAKRTVTKDACLSDICLGTSAAPTYLPPIFFKNGNDHDSREFNLIDGAIAANNPSLVAIGEVKRQIRKEDPNFLGIKPNDSNRYLVISLGTGVQKQQPKYDAKMAKEWGGIRWLNPLIEAFMEGSSDLVDIHNTAFFESCGSIDKYLRIQDDSLTGDMASTDKATNKNLKDLVNAGHRLLEKPVTRVNIDTGIVEPVPNGGTNGAALHRYAEQLSEERKLRELRSYEESA